MVNQVNGGDGNPTQGTPIHEDHRLDTVMPLAILWAARRKHQDGFGEEEGNGISGSSRDEIGTVKALYQWAIESPNDRQKAQC